MATPLTDSINALTQYANETTGKQDTTLSDAVGSLVEGYRSGGNEAAQEALERTKSINFNYDNTTWDAEELEINNSKITSFSSCFRQAGCPSSSIILNTPNVTSFNMMFFSSSNLPESIIINNCAVANFSSFLRGGGSGISSGTVNIVLPHNVISNSYNAHFRCKTLSATSLVYIANALVAIESGGTSRTLDLCADSQTLCASTIGTVKDGIFSIDSSGSETLSSFITDIKGWTIGTD